jgi:hypothetical protein
VKREFKDCDKHGPYRIYDGQDHGCPGCAAGDAPYDPQYVATKRLEAECTSLFGNMWHTVSTLKKAEGTHCYWCLQPATTTAMVNIWGNVHITPCCAAHRKIHHGIARDDL